MRQNEGQGITPPRSLRNFQLAEGASCGSLECHNLQFSWIEPFHVPAQCPPYSLSHGKMDWRKALGDSYVGAGVSNPHHAGD